MGDTCDTPLNDDGCCGTKIKDCNEQCGGTAEDRGCGCGVPIDFGIGSAGIDIDYDYANQEDKVCDPEAKNRVECPANWKEVRTDETRISDPRSDDADVWPAYPAGENCICDNFGTPNNVPAGVIMKKGLMNHSFQPLSCV